MEQSDMPLLNIIKKLFGILFAIIGLVRRILNKIICRAKRFRRDSGTVLPMTTDQISADVPLSVPSNDMNEVEFEPWDAWGNDPQSGDGRGYNPHDPQNVPYQNKVEEYRYKQQQKLHEVPKQDPNFFEDMSPEFHKAKKLLVRSKQQEERNSNHTQTNKFAVNNFIPNESEELGQWDESEAAWEAEASEDLSWEAEAAIRDKKRQDRERRHAEQQRKKLERDTHKTIKKDGMTAVKIS